MNIEKLCTFAVWKLSEECTENGSFFASFKAIIGLTIQNTEKQKMPNHIYILKNFQGCNPFKIVQMLTFSKKLI